MVSLQHFIAKTVPIWFFAYGGWAVLRKRFDCTFALFGIGLVLILCGALGDSQDEPDDIDSSSGLTLPIYFGDTAAALGIAYIVLGVVWIKYIAPLIA